MTKKFSPLRAQLLGSTALANIAAHLLGVRT